MADNINNIDIQVSNGVDAGIAPRLIEIADAADKASLSTGTLKSQLQALGSSGFSSLGSQLKNVASAQQQATQSINSTSSAAVNSVSSFRQLSAASSAASGSISGLTRATLICGVGIENLSSIMSVAIPVVGIIAAIGLVVELGEKVATLADNWGDLKKLSEEAIKSAIELQQDEIGILSNTQDATRRIIVAQAQLNADPRTMRSAGRAAGFAADAADQAEKVHTLSDQLSALKINLADVNSEIAKGTIYSSRGYFEGMTDSAKALQTQLPQLQEQIQKTSDDLKLAQRQQQASVLENQVAVRQESIAAAREGATAQRQANIEQLQSLESALHQIESLYGASAAVEAQYWSDIVTTSNIGSANIQKALDKAAAAQARLTSENLKLNSQFDTTASHVGTSAATSDLSRDSDTTRQLSQSGQQTQGYIQSLHNLSDAQRETAITAAQANTNWQLATGRISSAQAATDTYKNTLASMQLQYDGLISQLAYFKNADYLGSAQQQAGINDTTAALIKLRQQMDALKQEQPITAVSAGNVFGHAQGGLLANIQQQYKPLQELQSTFTDVFKTIEDGAADSIGRAIVYSKNLGDALRDVARSAISELISGMVKLGVQYVLNATLGQSIQAASTTASVTQAAATGAAWAAPAALVSLASFGANGAAADAAIATTTALTEALSIIPKFDVGTNLVPADMLALVHRGERIVPAADNRQLMDVLSSPQKNSGDDRPIHIHNYGSSQVQVQSLDHRINVFVTDQINQLVPGMVAAHAPGVIARELSNPNSKPSKALTQNTFTSRRR